MTRSNSDTAILVISSATLAIGLDALLLSIPPIRRVIKAADLDELVILLETVHPALIILDTSTIPQDPTAALELIRDLAPKSLRVLLSHSMIEYRALVYDSPDTVILNGIEPGRLARMLELLLSDDAGGNGGSNGSNNGGNSIANLVAT